MYFSGSIEKLIYMMCFKLLFSIAFQIMIRACRNLSVSLLFLCSSGHFCHSEEKQIQKKVHVDNLMPVPILHFYFLSFSNIITLLLILSPFQMFCLLLLSGHFTLLTLKIVASCCRANEVWSGGGKGELLSMRLAFLCTVCFLLTTNYMETKTKQQYIIPSLTFVAFCPKLILLKSFKKKKKK